MSESEPGDKRNAQKFGKHWKKGNRTYGANRRGFKGGRAPLYPAGTELFLVSLKLADPECAMALWLGDGIITRGIRRALDIAYTASRPKGLAPVNRLEMEAQVRKEQLAKKVNTIKAEMARSFLELEKEENLEEWEL